LGNGLSRLLNARQGAFDLVRNSLYSWVNLESRLILGIRNAMKASLKPGLTGVRRIAIDRERTIAFMGEEARVYATPRLIGDIEMTCRNLILEHADPGEDSVGVEVAITHLAPTLPGMTAEISVEVTAVEKRRVSFAVAVRDELEEVSRGTHVRFVVDVAKTVERLKAKAARREPA
jgi:fluoroacetyl-CoA thioesterase